MKASLERQSTTIKMFLGMKRIMMYVPVHSIIVVSDGLCHYNGKSANFPFSDRSIIRLCHGSS